MTATTAEAIRDDFRGFLMGLMDKYNVCIDSYETWHGIYDANPSFRGNFELSARGGESDNVVVAPYVIVEGPDDRVHKSG